MSKSVRTAPSRRRARPTARATTSRRPTWVTFAALAVLLSSIAGAFWYFNRPPDTGDAAPIATLKTQDFHSLAFSPQDPNTLFFGHHNGLMKSIDGGNTWQPVPTLRADAMSLAIPPSAPQTMYAAGHDVFYKSTDGGATWQPVPNNLPGADIHAFTVDPNDPQVVYAYVVGQGLFRSADGGNQWKLLTTELPTSLTALTVIPGPIPTLFVGAGNRGILVSNDGGQSFKPASPAPGAEAFISLEYDEATGTLYTGTDQGLYKSTDRGATWQRLGLDTEVLAVAVSPSRPTVLVVVNGKGQVFRSDDSGQTWAGKQT